MKLEKNQIACNWCNASNYYKHGKRRTRLGENQIYFCKSCRHNFTGKMIKETQEQPKEVQQRLTYPQDWQAYNSAQTNEKRLFLQILSDLSAFSQSKRNKIGRPKAKIADLVFCCCLKTYSSFSGRRLISDLNIAYQTEFISTVPHFNTILRAFNKRELTPFLQELVRLSSLPMKEVELDFTADSTGFSTSLFSRWVDKRFGKDKTERIWVKAHAMSGVKTNVITSIEISGGRCNDSPYFIPLLNKTAKGFNIKEVSADRAYSSRANLEAVIKIGAFPFILFKCNATDKAKGSLVWKNIYKYFASNKEEFLKSYHKRSNAEATFSTLKRKFGNNVTTKNFTGMINEILCKVICHNICVLIQELFERNVEVPFCAKHQLAPIRALKVS